MIRTAAAEATRSTGATLVLLLLLLLSSPTTTNSFVASHCRAYGRKIVREAAEHKLPSTSRPAGRAETRMAMRFPLFSFGQKKADKQNADAAAGLSAELFSMLTDEGDKPDDASVMKKIEELEAAPGVTFNKDYLYGGPWRVLWKTNTEWQRYFDPLNSMADNRAYQWYEEDGSVTNIAQAFGDKLYVTVDGQGAPASESTELPYEVNVEVSRGWLHALGGKIPLNFIKGKGTTFVVYNDAKLRVFRSDTGGVVVQTKADEVVPT